MSNHDPLELTQSLLAFDTINPPGNERECVHYIGSLLEPFGFDLVYREFADRRTCLVARRLVKSGRLPICFSGHLDTVPLGQAPWRVDPFAGEIDGDRVFGRGASDMKSGCAAMVIAAIKAARQMPDRAEILLVLTAGEENGCEGAKFLATRGNILGTAGAIVVGEPTGNYPIIGHKGALWLNGVTTGKTAHGSMPDQGVNAIYKMAHAVTQLQSFDFNIPLHPVLGAPTLNVGTISGGININSVPDRATIQIDIRTIPQQSGAQICRQLQTCMGREVELEIIDEAGSVATDADNQWIQSVFKIATPFIGESPEPRGVTYFTDASALIGAFDHPPTVILGPGEPDMAHKTDEYCYISKLEAAVEIYYRIMEQWCEE